MSSADTGFENKLLKDINFTDIGFKIEVTRDGSPSLRQQRSVIEKYLDGESMHHSGGACAETALIYGNCIEKVFKNTESPHFLVVGLGLGYIEMFIAKQALLLDQKVGSILSFETVPELKQFFLAWVHDDQLSSETQKVYDDAAAFVLSGSGLRVEQLKVFLQKFFKTPADIQNALEDYHFSQQKFHGLLYDAFSGKTTPQLWDENFLIHFLKDSAAERVFFATYACRGSLKRALLAEGFAVEMLLGFEGKRYRTSAQRPPPPDLPLLFKEKRHLDRN